MVYKIGIVTKDKQTQANETGEVQNTSKDVTSNESNTDCTHDKRKHG